MLLFGQRNRAFNIFCYCFNFRTDRQSLKDRQIKSHRKHRSKERDRKVEENGITGQQDEPPRQQQQQQQYEPPQQQQQDEPPQQQQQPRKVKKRQSSKPRHERRRKHSENSSSVEPVEQNHRHTEPDSCELVTLPQTKSDRHKLTVEFRPVSALRDPSRKRSSSNKKVSFTENSTEIHSVCQDPSAVDLNPTESNGSPEREDRDQPPPLEPIQRPIFLTDPGYLVEEDRPSHFDRIRGTPPRLAPESDQIFGQNMSDHESDNLPALEATEVAEAPKKSQKPKEPPVTFRDFNVSIIK